MKTTWNEEKNKWLKDIRGISFDEILSGKIVTIIPHLNQEKYPNQKVIVILYNNYTYYIPFVIEKNKALFLKTIIPSRKLNKKYNKKYEKK